MSGKDVTVIERQNSPHLDEVPREDDGGGSHRLVCAACETAITNQKWQVAVNGKHAHTYFNPHGLVFHVGCFGAAPGLQMAGAPSSEFSWFPGYQWRIALCVSCHRHLGWDFSGGVQQFQALILDRLVEVERED